MSAIALVSDLMMQSQVSGAAERAGVSLVIVSSADALWAKATVTPPDLVVVDLSHPGLEPAALMQRLQPLLATGARTVAFGPHVHKARLEAAAAAGFTAVLSRGQFHANMEHLLAGREA